MTALLAVPATQALASGYNLAGTGSKALAMGGAFRGIADDWSAVFWNPAGLAGQGNSIYLEGKLLMPTSTITGTDPFLKSGETTSEDAMFPAGAFGMTYKINEKMTLGLGVYAPTAAGATFNNLFAIEPTDMMGEDPGETDWDGMMTVIDIHPSIGYQINDKLSVGLGLTLKYGSVSFAYPIAYPTGYTSPMPEYLALYAAMEGTGIGFGANIGILYDVTPKLHIGASYSSAASIGISGTMDQTLYSPSILYGTVEATVDVEADFPTPQEAGLGIAYDVNDKLTVGVDVMWTNWTAVDVVPITVTGTDLSMTLGATTEPTDQELALNYEDVIRFNLGAAYKFNEKLDLYVGYYYDPSAIPVEELDPAITDFVDKMNFSFGAKYMITPKIGAVGYYEYVFGKAREAEANPDGGNYAGWYDLTVGTISVGVTYLF